jgi:hypothetical protein
MVVATVPETSAPTRTRQRQAAELKERARSIYIANRALGHAMTGTELGEACGMKERWGRLRIEEVLAADAGQESASSPVPVDSSAQSAPPRHDTTPAVAEQSSLPPIVTPPSAAELSPASVEEAPAEEPAPVEQDPAPVAPERHDSGTIQVAPRKRPVVWPVLLLMLPATVAIWSGWVGLGHLAGFGPVQPLPGIVDGFEIDTSITLPIGMETYAGYALYVWLSGKATGRALTFARWSAITALVVGALGQVAYHVMVAAGLGAAPWWITAAVACLPVGVLGMGAALAHMVRAEPDLHSVPAVSDSNLEG